MKLTDHRTSDSSQVPHLNTQINKEIDAFIGDPAYDRKKVFKGLIDTNQKEPKFIVPPIKGAVMSEENEFKQRNKHIKFINDHGRDTWEMASGYTMQIKFENGFYRYKEIIGRNLAARLPENQVTEVNIGCLILNKMGLSGLPKYGKE